MKVRSFAARRRPLRRLNDIALSGDGEPTAAANFDQAVERCAAVRRRHRLDDVKLVLITNASLFHRPRVRRALETLDANNGEIWAKLDAGTRRLLRPSQPFGRSVAADSRQPAGSRRSGGRSSSKRYSCGFEANRRRRPS